MKQFIRILDDHSKNRIINMASQLEEEFQKFSEWVKTERPEESDHDVLVSYLCLKLAEQGEWEHIHAEASELRNY